MAPRSYDGVQSSSARGLTDRILPRRIPAKAALDGLTRGLAREVGPAGVRVVSVAPGYFDSDMTAGIGPDQRRRIERRTPLGRLGSVEDVLGVVRFLTSPAASFITGQTITVDGGYTC